MTVVSRTGRIGIFALVLGLSALGAGCSSSGGGGTEVNVLYFSANDGLSGSELWKVEGTELPTMVKNINPGGNSYPYGFTEFDGLTYFSATDFEFGRELWQTDGTSAGTRMVGDLNAPAGSAVPAFSGPSIPSGSPEYLTVLGGKLYFTGYVTGGSSRVLCSYDPASGAFSTHPATTGTYSDAYDLVALGGKLYFRVYNGSNYRIWSHDPAAGTVTEVPGQDALGSNYAYNLTAAGSTLYFNAYRPSPGRYFLHSLSTSAGAFSYYPVDSEGGAVESPESMTLLDGKVFFRAYSGSSYDLYSIDFASPGALPVKSGATEAIPGFNYFHILSPFQGKLFLGVYTNDMGNEPWVFDPATNTPSLIKNIWPDLGYINGSYPWPLGVMRGKLYFAAHDGYGDGMHGRELWSWDGSKEPVMVMDIWPGLGSGVDSGD